MKKIHLQYFHNLDGLRGLAAFSVLIFHFFLDTRVTSNMKGIEFIRQLTEILQHGVTLFFVISGFVITRILINNKRDSNYFLSFYKRRALRIFPLYYLYLIIHFYVYPYLLGIGPNLDFNMQLPVYFYIHNLDWLTGLRSIAPGHFWSLAVEEHFYFIWPLIIFIIPNQRLKIVTIFLILLSIPLKAFFLKEGIDINYNTFSRYDSILVGCFLSVLEKMNNYSFPKLKLKTFFSLCVFIFIFGVIVYTYQDKIFFIKSIFKHFILSSFFGLIIYVLIQTSSSDNLLNSFLRSNAMQYFGRISYGLYVWHMLAISICYEIGIQSFMLNFLITNVITLFLAHISYHYYELIFLKFK